MLEKNSREDESQNWCINITQISHWPKKYAKSGQMPHRPGKANIYIFNFSWFSMQGSQHFKKIYPAKLTLGWNYNKWKNPTVWMNTIESRISAVFYEDIIQNY